MTLSSAEARLLLTAGLAEYLGGRFWQAHERWEKLWRSLAPPEKNWVQGLILLAAAAWHLERNHEAVTRRLLALAAARLAGYPELPGVAGAGELASRAQAAAASAEVSLPPVTIAER